MVARAEARYEVSLEDRTARALRNIRGNLGQVDKGISVLAKGFVGLGAVVGVGSLLAIGRQSIDAADRIGKLSDRLGVSTEALSEYHHVAELSGVSVETLNLGWQRMTRRIAEAAQGTGEARGALAELNLDVNALSELAPDQQFEAIADAMQSVTNQSDRVRLSMKLFDSEGVALVQTMGNGAAGIRDMRSEARELGKSLDREQTQAAARFNDELTRMNASFGALNQTIALGLAGPMADVTDWLNETIKTMGAGAFRVRSFFADMFGLDAVAAEGPRQLAVLRERMIEVQDEIRERTADIIATNQRIGSIPPESAAAKILKGEIARIQVELDALRAEEERIRSQIVPADSVMQGVGSAPDPVVTARAQRNEILTDLDRERFMSEANFAAASVKLSEETARQQREIAEARFDTMAGIFGNLSTLMSSESRKAFEVGKAAAIAETVISTYAAAQKVFEFWANKNPVLGATAAGAAIVAGLARVDAIRRTQFGGGAAGGGGGTGGIPGTPGGNQDLPALPQSGVAERTGHTTQIIISGDMYGFDDFTQRVTEAVQAATDSDQIIISRNSRQALEFAG